MGWNDWKRRFHAPRETDYDLLRRVGNTPPEFWSGREAMEMRRLRAKRRRYVAQLDREGRNPNRVKSRYPAGAFWPDTPRYDRNWRRDALWEGRRTARDEREWKRVYGYWPDMVPPPASQGWWPRQGIWGRA